MKEILEKSIFPISTRIRGILWSLIAIGIAVFIVGLFLENKEEELVRVWQTLLINVLFWGGISQAGVIFSVIWQLTDAKWGRPFKRLAEAFSAFLPVSFVMFLLVFLGGHVLYEWTHSPMLHHGVAVKSGWLNFSFFVTRNIFGLLLMYGLSFWFVYHSLRPDFGYARKLIAGWGGKCADFFLKNYRDHETEVIALELRSRRIAPALAIVYGVTVSLIAFDFVMSLDQSWFSTLFGVFFIVGNLQAALGILMAISVTVRKRFGLEEYMTINRFHDMAKLVLAFTLLWTYMGFSQFIVIWYGNMAEETSFLIIRFLHQPWATMFLVLLGWLFPGVLFGLMPRTLCRIPSYVRIAGIYVAVGQFLVIYFLVAPSLQHPGHYHISFGLYEIFITLGFFGAFALCYLTFLSKVPLLPISDKHLCKTWHGR